MWSNIFLNTEEEYYTDTLHAVSHAVKLPEFSSVLTREQVEKRFSKGTIIPVVFNYRGSFGPMPEGRILVCFEANSPLNEDEKVSVERTIRLLVQRDISQRTDRIHQIVIDCSHHSTDLMSFLHKVVHRALIPEFHFEAASIFYYDRKTSSLILGATTGIDRQEEFGLKKSDIRYFEDDKSYTAKAWRDGTEIVENVFQKRPLKKNTFGESVTEIYSRIYAPLRRWNADPLDAARPLGVIRAVNVNRDYNFHPLTSMEAIRLRLLCDAVSVITERYLKTASILYDQERATHGYNTDLAAIRYAAQNIDRWLGRIELLNSTANSEQDALLEVSYRVRDILAVQDNMASQLMTVMHLSNSTRFVTKPAESKFCVRPYTDIIMRIVAAKRGMSECYARNELQLTYNNKPRAEDDFIRIPPLRVPVGDLYLVFRNIVENSIKYSVKGMKPQLDISWSRIGNRFVDFSFSDQGIGIPPNEQNFLLREGFRGRRAQELQLRGNGLGLTVSKTVIERAGGTLSFKSKPPHERGACFVVRIPIL